MRLLRAHQASKVPNFKSARPEDRQPARYPPPPTLRRGLFVGLSLAALGLAAHRALSSQSGAQSELIFTNQTLRSKAARDALESKVQGSLGSAKSCV